MKKRNIKHHRRRLKKKYIYFLVSFLVVIISISLIYYFFGFGMFKTSINDGAKKYSNASCVAFYPDNDEGKNYAKELCNETKEKTIYDYSINTVGDYTRVNYDNGLRYYFKTDSGKAIDVSEINDEAKMIISDYLRYSMKKDEIDEAYTLDYLNDTYYLNLDLSEVTIKPYWQNLRLYFPKYDYTLDIPLNIIGQYLGANLGDETITYVKPRYVSENRKMICFTFDDGPSLTTSPNMIEELYKYDSSATFFLIGNKLGENQINLVKEGIDKGMEYGSHTYDHVNLKKLDYESGNYQIMAPSYILNDNLGYQMTLYRPPYGYRNDETDSYSDLTAILWNVDSEDWSIRKYYDYDETVNLIVDGVKEYGKENKVVLFHDIYDTSVAAASKLVEYYIDQGYQIVNVSELMEHLGVSDVKRFYGGS